MNHIRKWQVTIDSPDNEYFMRRHAESMTRAFTKDPSDLKLMTRIRKFMDLLNEIFINIVLWQLPNDYHFLAKTTYIDCLARARSGDEVAGIRLDDFRKLGEKFHFNLGAVLPES